MSVTCATVPLRDPPPRRLSVTSVLVAGLPSESATCTVTAGENTVPAVATAGASCVIWMTLGVAVAIVNGAAGVAVKMFPAEDAARVELPDVFMRKWLDVAGPSGAVRIVVVPLVKAPTFNATVIGTPLDAIL